MRRLTNKQQECIDEFAGNLPFNWTTPYVDATNLDGIILDGHFALANLRALVAALTTYEYELLHNLSIIEKDTEERL